MKKLLIIISIIIIGIGSFLLFKIKQDKEHTNQIITAIADMPTQKNIVETKEKMIEQKTEIVKKEIDIDNPNTIAIKDCGNNFDCFIESSKTCSPAKVNKIVSMDFSYEVKNDVDFEIKGIKNNECEISFTIKTSTLSFIDDPNASQQIRDQVKEMMKSAQDEVNKTVATKPLNNCLFKDKALTTMLEGIKSSAFHLSVNSIANDQYKVFENLSNNSCNGPFILN